MYHKFNELFIKAFDSGVKITHDHGGFTKASGLEEYEHVIYNSGDIDVVKEELISHGDHHVEYEFVIKARDRYFRCFYVLGGKDLDEVMNVTDFAEVYPQEVTTINYTR